MIKKTRNLIKKHRLENNKTSTPNSNQNFQNQGQLKVSFNLNLKTKNFKFNKNSEKKWNKKTCFRPKNNNDIQTSRNKQENRFLYGDCEINQHKFMILKAISNVLWIGLFVWQFSNLRRFFGWFFWPVLGNPRNFENPFKSTLKSGFIWTLNLHPNFSKK
jgi:hypothetical protein